MITVTAQEAVRFVADRHYTGSASPGSLRFGWEIDGRLAGVSIYDTGNHAMRQGVFGPDYYPHVYHHHRLALELGVPKCTASEFLGACMRQIRLDRPDIWALVTYADSCEGHVGTIYQATNALYTGVVAKGNLKFLTPEGVIKPTQSLPGTWPERRELARQKGWDEIRCKGKYRYVYLLATRVQHKARPSLLWETMPYPSKELLDTSV